MAETVHDGSPRAILDSSDRTLLILDTSYITQRQSGTTATRGRDTGVGEASSPGPHLSVAAVPGSVVGRRNASRAAGQPDSDQEVIASWTSLVPTQGLALQSVACWNNPAYEDPRVRRMKGLR